MKTFFKILLKFMVSIANIFLAPANNLIYHAFPDLSILISKFTDFIDTFINNGILYFFSILPPNAARFVIFYLSILIILYTISLAMHVLVKVVEIIKAVKIW